MIDSIRKSGPLVSLLVACGLVAAGAILGEAGQASRGRPRLRTGLVVLRGADFARPIALARPLPQHAVPRPLSAAEKNALLREGAPPRTKSFVVAPSIYSRLTVSQPQDPHGQLHFDDAWVVMGSGAAFSPGVDNSVAVWEPPYRVGPLMIINIVMNPGRRYLFDFALAASIENAAFEFGNAEHSLQTSSLDSGHVLAVVEDATDLHLWLRPAANAPTLAWWRFYSLEVTELLR
ncbi:MAG TPA: hypothetical protein VMS75_07730 [Terriglobales bacterium]|nr:hypothetical protein [Terriglobales bacterium]